MLQSLESRRLLATFTVTSADDSAPVDSPASGTLRWAVEQANAATSPSTIDFSPDFAAQTQTVALLQGPLELQNSSDPIAIDGPIAAMTVSGGGASRVFQIDPNVTASISGLTISGGSASGSGGGVYNQGNTTLTNCTVSGDTANCGGGLADYGRTASLTLTSCTISGNTAVQGGGLDILHGTATLIGCMVRGNTAQYGGGLGNYGNLASLSLSGCTVSGNIADQNGGGLFDLNSATLTVADCTVGGNTAVRGGGLEILRGAATLTDCMVGGNTANYGGGLYNGSGTATLTDCTVGGNTARYGGGLDGLNATATLTDCTVSDDTADEGGGLRVFDGTATLTECSLYGDTADEGGGLWILDGMETLTDCTISGDTAGQNGGGLDNYGGMLTLVACTVSGDAAGQNGGGLYELNGTAMLSDTLVAGNIDVGGASDIGVAAAGRVTGTYDLVGTGGSGDITGGSNHDVVLTALTEIGLAPLGDYGGPTRTMALLPGSAALDAGTAIIGLTTDQRGMSVGSSVDIGAFQSQGFTLTPVGGSTPQSADTNAAFIAPLSVTVTANDALEPVAGGIVTFTITANSEGGSAALSGSSSPIGVDGVASVTATANSGIGSYTVRASALGAGGAEFSLTNRAEPTVIVTDSGGTFDSLAFNASATVAGIVPGVDNGPAASLEGVAPSLTYYAGTYTSEAQLTGVTALSGAPVDPGSYTVLASFPSSADYVTAAELANFRIDRASPTIAWTAPATIVYGTVPSATQLDATASVPGTFVYSAALGTVLPAGDDTLTVTFTPTDTTDYQTVASTLTIDVAQATPTITWATPAVIVLGTPLSSAQLDALASVPGTISYSPATGTIPGVGTDSLMATFTPTDATDYKSVSSTVELTVLPPTPMPTPTPTPTGPPPVIVNQQPLFHRKTSKKGKPAGKATLSGFTLDFGTPLNPSSAADAANYGVDTIAPRKGKKSAEPVLQPIMNFTVSYDATDDAVTFAFGSPEAFRTGGRISVLTGVTTATGGSAGEPMVFTISDGGTSISPV